VSQPTEHDDERREEPAPVFPDEPQTSVQYEAVAPAPADESDLDARRGER
jgi:hypothetical protein